MCRRWKLRKEPKEMLEKFPNKKSVFSDLISRLDTAVERISELEDISTEVSKTKKRTKT